VQNDIFALIPEVERETQKIRASRNSGYLRKFHAASAKKGSREP
jgi:hypothetical protein